MSDISYPNLIFVFECEKDLDRTERGLIHGHFVVVVAAISKELAMKHVKDMIGIKTDPIWLMNSRYPTIWTSDGNAIAEEQVKILYNGSDTCYIKE